VAMWMSCDLRDIGISFRLCPVSVPHGNGVAVNRYAQPTEGCPNTSHRVLALYAQPTEGLYAERGFANGQRPLSGRLSAEACSYGVT